MEQSGSITLFCGTEPLTLAGRAAIKRFKRLKSMYISGLVYTTGE